MVVSLIKKKFYSAINKISKAAGRYIIYFEFLCIQAIVKLITVFSSPGNYSLRYVPPDEYQTFLESCDQGIIDDNIHRADEILGNRFDLLGVKNISWGDAIPWHVDLQSGHQWDNKFHVFLLPVSTVDDDYEKKLPWELSRLQYLFVLYKAYAITRRQEYYDKLVFIVDDWLKKNPPFSGVNWQNAMEVGVRAANIILIASYLKDNLPEEISSEIDRSLLFHFFYILANPEIAFSRKLQVKKQQKIGYVFRNNHYLFNIIGGLFISFYFQGLPWMASCRKSFVNRFFREIDFQVLDDGVNFEGSIGYHGYVLETILFTSILLKRNNIDLPKASLKKLFRMLDFTVHYTRPDGTFPIIGDNDSGKLFTLGKYSKRSHINLLTIGATFLKSSDFKTDPATFDEEAFWLLGSQGKMGFDSLPFRNKPIQSKAFEQGGYYIIRDKSDYLVISTCKNIDRGSGGHFHNDCFSFELYAGDKLFVVDPGCYTYASKTWRNLFRSSKYHNSVVIDDQELNRIDNHNLFCMENDARPQVLAWEVGEDRDLFIGRHYGYCRLKCPVTVTREITYYKKHRYWEVVDELAGVGEHKLEWNFHLTPMKVRVNEDNPFMVTTLTPGTNLQITPIGNDSNLAVKLVDGWISYEYGEKTKAPIISYNTNIDLDKKNVRVGFQFKSIFTE